MNALMQNVLTQSILMTAIILIAGPAQAQNPPWCAIMDNDGNTQCNFYTEQQCLQTLSGIGGRCILNPAGSAPQPAPTLPSSENAPGLLPLQLENPGPPPGLGAVPPPPNN
jgi:hypothetical protein